MAVPTLWNEKSSANDLGTIVSSVALANSLNGKGCLLGIVDSSFTVLSEHDIARARSSPVTADDPSAWVWHRLLPTTSVSSLGVEAMQTLSGLDGATLISTRGALVAYGAVVRTAQTPQEGARTTAARELSKTGLVIKVSADGPISVWEHGGCLVEI